MGWKNINSAQRDDLLKRKISGERVEDLAAEIAMRPTTLDRRLRDWAARNKVLSIPAIGIKKWDSPPHFSGDSVVAGDFHSPFVNYSFAEDMLHIASKLKIKRLIIAGDLFNMTVFSRYPRLTTPVPFSIELSATRKMLSDMLGIFDHIDLLLGNHERRLIYTLLGEASGKDIEKLIGLGKITVYDYSYALLHTKMGIWRITHQANYSSSAQTVGIKLAHKYGQHIVTHHQHRVSKGLDSSGRYVVIDNGCMVDPSMLDYVSVVDSASPEMNNGFVVIRDGTGEVYSNNQAFSSLE